MKLKKDFFSRNAKIVARELLGKVLVRKVNGETFRSRIVETESYFGADDPASRASKGKNKISEMMWEAPGKILVYNVHMYKMLNFVCDKVDTPSAVLIRALEPLNFDARCSGPGLLSNALSIDKSIHGEDVCVHPEIWIKDDSDFSARKSEIDIVESFRIGVARDLGVPMRFYIRGNEFVSRK